LPAWSESVRDHDEPEDLEGYATLGLDEEFDDDDDSLR